MTLPLQHLATFSSPIRRHRRRRVVLLRRRCHPTRPPLLRHPPSSAPRDSPPPPASRNPLTPSPPAMPPVRLRRPLERGRLPPRPAPATPASGAPPPPRRPPPLRRPPRPPGLRRRRVVLLLRAVLPGLWGSAVRLAACRPEHRRLVLHSCPLNVGRGTPCGHQPLPRSQLSSQIGSC
jgi:hypothetical protein